MSNQDTQYTDACPFNPSGIVCKGKNKDCASCGWYPAEAKRRKLQRAGKEKGGKKHERPRQDR